MHKLLRGVSTGSPPSLMNNSGPPISFRERAKVNKDLFGSFWQPFVTFASGLYALRAGSGLEAFPSVSPTFHAGFSPNDTNQSTGVFIRNFFPPAWWVSPATSALDR
jgi:hypothetical protein